MTAAIPAGPFGCILADPPWHFQTYSGGKSVPTQAPDPYRTMELDHLVALPVASVAAKDCALVMWASGTHTDRAIALAKAWGFRFVRGDLFVWVKSREGYSPSIGMGYWTRNGAEVAMLFAKGSPKPLARNVEQVIFCPRGAHSAKPEVQYERIEALIGGPYLELFARSTRRGWSSWGGSAVFVRIPEGLHKKSKVVVVNRGLDLWTVAPRIVPLDDGAA